MSWAPGNSSCAIVLNRLPGKTTFILSLQIAVPTKHWCGCEAGMLACRWLRTV
jgi:hypothetical protein